jgi:hypothetical protein
MIVKAPGYRPETHKALLASPAFSTNVVCVSDFEQALGAAAGLVQDGVQLIELCGGFTAQEAARLQVAIGGTVPVGVVRYSPEEQEHLAALFA